MRRRHAFTARTANGLPAYTVRTSGGQVIAAADTADQAIEHARYLLAAAVVIAFCAYVVDERRRGSDPNWFAYLAYTVDDGTDGTNQGGTG